MDWYTTAKIYWMEKLTNRFGSAKKNDNTASNEPKPIPFFTELGIRAKITHARLLEKSRINGRNPSPASRTLNGIARFLGGIAGCVGSVVLARFFISTGVHPLIADTLGCATSTIPIYHGFAIPIAAFCDTSNLIQEEKQAEESRHDLDKDYIPHLFALDTGRATTSVANVIANSQWKDPFHAAILAEDAMRGLSNIPVKHQRSVLKQVDDILSHMDQNHPHRSVVEGIAVKVNTTLDLSNST